MTKFFAPRFKQLFCGLLILMLLTFGKVAYGGEIKVSFPPSVEVGMPFIIHLKTSQLPLEGKAYWCGQQIPIHFSEKTSYSQSLLMGTSAKTASPGRATFRMEFFMNGKAEKFAVPVEILAKSYPRELLTLPEKMVVPPSHELVRIKEEQRVVRQTLLDIRQDRFWDLPFFKPVDSMITSAYGKRRVLNGKPSNPHTGIDLRASAGTDVYAAADGIVTLVAEHYFSGHVIYINSGSGVVSLYCHLSKPLVQGGEHVRRGDLIAKSGVSGRITGPHLHFGMALQGQLVDPMPLFTTGEKELSKKNKEQVFRW